MKKKYLKHINTLFMVLPMTLIMAAIGILRNYGFQDGWLTQVFKTWSVMFPVAYVAAFFIIPMAKKLAEKAAAIGQRVGDRS